MRPMHFLKAAATLVAVILAFVIATPSAQAVGTYNRRLRSVTYGECIAASSSTPSATTFSACSGDLTKFYVLVKSDSYMGTGHEVWQIKSAHYSNTCVIAGNSNGARLTLGSCAYSGSVHNKFEVFHSTLNGESIDQLKDIEAWENDGQHRCIVDLSTTSVPLMGACNLVYESYWNPDAW
jgi:hypothetical protein